MTDQELTERAAAAAGLAGEWSPWWGDNGGFCLAPEHRNPAQVWWAPLVSDRDAFRLMVTLSLQVTVWDQDFMHHNPHVEVREQLPNGMECVTTEPITKDALSATRRAITQAAAAIGRE